MELVLSAPAIKLLTKAVVCLARVSACSRDEAFPPQLLTVRSRAGSDILMEVMADDAVRSLGCPRLCAPLTPPQLILRAINTTKSAYFAVRIRTDSFDTFRVVGTLQTGVYSKHLLTILRATKADQLTIRMAEPGSPRLTLELRFSKAGLVKTYECSTLDDIEVLCANIDRRTLPVRLVLRPKELNKLLANFHSGQSDVTLLSLPDLPPGPDGERMKRLRLASYADPAKTEPAGASLSTRLAVDTHEELIVGYQHRSAGAAEATVNLKDLKVMVAFCESVDSDISLFFDQPGQPLLAVPDRRGRITSHFHNSEQALVYEAELVLATMLEESVTALDAAEVAALRRHMHAHTQQPAGASRETPHAGSAPQGAAPEGGWTGQYRASVPLSGAGAGAGLRWAGAEEREAAGAAAGEGDEMGEEEEDDMGEVVERGGGSKRRRAPPPIGDEEGEAHDAFY